MAGVVVVSALPGAVAMPGMEVGDTACGMATWAVAIRTGMAARIRTATDIACSRMGRLGGSGRGEVARVVPTQSGALAFSPGRPYASQFSTFNPRGYG